MSNKIARNTSGSLRQFFCQTQPFNTVFCEKTTALRPEARASEVLPMSDLLQVILSLQKADFPYSLSAVA